MAYKNNPSSGGDMYSDGPDESAPAPAPPQEDEHAEGEGETALVPKSLCPGMNVGEEMVVKITAVHDDQYEVSYAPEKGKDEFEAPAEKASVPSEMDSLME